MSQIAARAESPSDADLVHRVLDGQVGEFEQLVRRHNQRLYRAARAITRHDQDAEDVLQQAWLNVFRNLRTFRGDLRRFRGDLRWFRGDLRRFPPTRSQPPFSSNRLSRTSSSPFSFPSSP